MINTHAVIALSYRDLMKFLRDPVRIISTFIFPLIFIGVMGGTFEASFGSNLPFSILTFTFTGVLAQTMFQSSAMGLISLIEDRENDFSQEIFVSPISRYAIVVGKISGEALVSMTQGIGIIAFGVIIGIPVTVWQLLALIPVSLMICFFGGAFGVIIMANLKSQRAATQVFPFIMLPQYFLAGVFAPIDNLPGFLNALSLISPMRYAVDLLRGVYYVGVPEYSQVVLKPPLFNTLIITGLFFLFLVVGTFSFVKKEKNR